MQNEQRYLNAEKMLELNPNLEVKTACELLGVNYQDYQVWFQQKHKIEMPDFLQGLQELRI